MISVPLIRRGSIFFIYSFILLFPLFSQTMSEKYDWNFQKMDLFGCDWSSDRACTVFVLDTSHSVDGRHHPVLWTYKENGSSDNMYLFLKRIMILPEKLRGDSLRVRFQYKMQPGADFTFRLVTISEQGTWQDSARVGLKGGAWNTAVLSVPRKRARAIRVGMDYVGTADSLQRVWLGGIEMDLDGRDLADYPCEASSLQDSVRMVKRFKKKYAVPLSEAEETGLLTGIRELSDKKIIGLGEFAHGSYSVMQAKFQWCKNLIRSHDCKLILLEYPQDESVLFNLYVQGLISEEYVGKIEKSLRIGMLDYELYLDFFEWLKDYNRTAENKVFILGVDKDWSSGYSSYFPVFETLLGKQKCIPYWELLQQKNYREVVARLKSDTGLIKKIGEKNMAYLAWLFEKMEKSEYLPAPGSEDRDTLMAARIEDLVGLLLDGSQKCVLSAHSEHISKLPYLKTYPSQATLGSLLKERYGTDYFALSFQAGEGVVLDEKGVISFIMYRVNLPRPPYNSFENVALGSGMDYFYYPTRYLDNDILQLGSLTRPNIGKDYYGFSPVKVKYDALVFIRICTPHKNIGFSVINATEQ